MASVRVDRLPERAWIAAVHAGADLGRVAGKVLADDVQAELAQDRGGGLAFEEEFERGSDELVGGGVTAPEAGGETGWHAHLVAGARGCLDAEGAIGLLGNGDLRHAVTLASRRSMPSWPGPGLHSSAQAALPTARRPGYSPSSFLRRAHLRVSRQLVLSRPGRN
jgi:hypothetical protein